ncbi:hypothetical protein [Paenibacillus sp. RUD330]|uniref:hypothetical protein n=1 Tax=Paenibacillus sp. RUD330 TaxID=2023772 RepID=UPI0012FD06B7|nr:hypothetical protein [Paenibacillus sp. RUD330]QID16057.1 hypothetical protein CIC07_25335 [Paenibacillus sp. RUD330]
MPEKTNVEAIWYLNKLHAFRQSGALVEAAECWLDKEIAELELDIAFQEDLK